VALSEANEIKLWDTQTGRVQRSIKTANAGSIAFSPDSRVLGASATSTKAGDFSIKLWDAATLRQVAELPGFASALTFSPDGRVLATVHLDRVTLWDTRTRKVRARRKLSRQIGPNYAVRWPHAFSPDGKLFCAADESFTHVWDTTTGERRTTLKGHLGRIYVLAWSPEGKTLATASGPTVKLWHVATGEELTTLVGENGVACLAFAPDGSLAVGNLLNSIRLWRTGSDANDPGPGK
jgi:WD40 repeat protein